MGLLSEVGSCKAISVQKDLTLANPLTYNYFVHIYVVFHFYIDMFILDF